MPKINLQRPLTLILTFEGLNASALGFHGCSWGGTPAMDELAARGVVWDRWTTPVDRPNGLICRWIEDAVPVLREGVDSGEWLLFSDDVFLKVPAAASDFDRCTLLPMPETDEPAASLDETAFAKSVAAMADEIGPDTRGVWFHSSVLRDRWDAPVEKVSEPEDLDPGRPAKSVPADGDATLGESDEWDTEAELNSESTLQLPVSAQPPRHRLGPDDDPDLLFAWMQRYAAQIGVIDRVVEELGFLLKRRRPRVLIAGTSGFALGENGWIGHRAGPLRSNDLRLPMMVSEGGPLRVPSVCSAGKFPEVLKRLLQGDPIIEPAEWGQYDEPFSKRVEMDSDRALDSVTTPGWFFVREHPQPEGNGDGSPIDRLFLKPDDVNDVNDVSRLRREVVDQFCEEID